MDPLRRQRGLGSMGVGHTLLLWFVIACIGAVGTPWLLRYHPRAVPYVGGAVVVLFVGLWVGAPYLKRFRNRRDVLHLRAHLQRDPSDPDRHCDLGYLLAEGGELEEAAACFRKAIAVSPNLARAHYALGHALKLQGDREAARQEMERAEALWKTERQGIERAETLWRTERQAGAVTLRDTNGIAVIQVCVRALDFDGAAALKEKLTGALSEGRQRIIVDLSGVKAMFAPGLGVIVKALVTARERNASLKWVLSPEAQKALDATRIATACEIYGDEAAALSAFAAAVDPSRG